MLYHKNNKDITVEECVIWYKKESHHFHGLLCGEIWQKNQQTTTTTTKNFVSFCFTARDKSICVGNIAYWIANMTYTILSRVVCGCDIMVRFWWWLLTPHTGDVRKKDHPKWLSTQVVIVPSVVDLHSFGGIWEIKHWCMGQSGSEVIRSQTFTAKSRKTQNKIITSYYFWLHGSLALLLIGIVVD